MAGGLLDQQDFIPSITASYVKCFLFCVFIPQCFVTALSVDVVQAERPFKQAVVYLKPEHRLCEKPLKQSETMLRLQSLNNPDPGRDQAGVRTAGLTHTSRCSFVHEFQNSRIISEEISHGKAEECPELTSFPICKHQLLLCVRDKR